MSPLEAPRTSVWMASDVPAPAPQLLDQSLPQALRDVVKQRPRAVALIHGGREMTFAQLWRLVRGMAAELRAVQAPEGPVAVLMQASPLSVAAWFACALAGRPFVLLEPGNPDDRNRMLMAKAGAALLLHDLPLDGVDLPRLTPSARRGQVRGLGAGLAPDAPAMLFPTSGSTGEPKLITYAARTLQVKLRASQALMRVQPGDRVLIAGSHANYGFLHHAMVFLLAGGALCLIDVKTEGLPGLFAAIQTQGVRHVRFTPSLFRLAAARPEGAAALALLQGMRFSGEPFLTADLDLARRVAPGALIQNVYGSTESALFLWTDRGETLPPGTVPIGRIYPLSAFTLRDESGAPVSRGEMGELVIRSDHHALGDWQDGSLNLSRFPPAKRGRLYATGDVARLQASGDLEVLGRSDRVVKINGQRVSLDEIESHIGKTPGVRQAVVAVKETAQGNPLVAFVTGEGRDLRSLLKTALPAHMIPGQFVWRDSLPLLPGGKTDRKALLASLTPEAAWMAAPTESLEALFARLLKLPSVGPDADFFSLGGDSLLLMDLQIEVEKRFGRKLRTQDFIRRATLRELARQMGQPLPEAPPTIGRAEGVELHFRQLSFGAGPVALILPGIVGGAGAETWVAARNFPDHAVWACDAAYAKGRTLDGGNWERALTAIAQAIRSGQAPQPALMAGYSMGGFLSWATARCLDADLAARVLMLDAWPVHRLKFHATGWMPPPGPNPETLLIACEEPARLRLLNAHKRRWEAEDGAMHRLTVPTLDHADICRPQVMGRLAPLTRAFAAHGLSRALPPPPGDLPTMAARILSAWKTEASPAEVEALLADRAQAQGNEARTALLYLAVLFARPALAKTFAAELAALPHGLAFFAKAAQALQTLPDRARPAPWARVFPGKAPPPINPATLTRALRLRAPAYFPPPAVSDPPRVKE